MLIRALAFDDLDELLALYTHLHESDTPLPERSVIEDVWRAALASANNRYYGAQVDEALVATCTLTIVPNLTRGCRAYGVIENVVTHSRHRRKGYATAVLQRALAEAWAAGCYKVMLMTGRKDEATARFYESAGFDRHEKQAFVAKPSAARG